MESRLQRRPWYAWIAVIVFPLLINGPVLLNILKSDPLLEFSFLQTNVKPGPLNIHPYFDPSVGIVLQPYGRLAAEDLIHGIMPWWDPYEGVGSPLAGEMSPAVFYPLNFFQLLPNGQTYLDVAVQIFAGLFALLLARRIGLGLFAGAIVAMLFECNGTFAWLGSGWCYPFPLLPLLIYGIELCFGALARERVAGAICIALAVAISISGCMIEIAFLDGLLGVAWAIFRLARSRGAALREGAARMIFGAVLGLLIASPLVIAFADDLHISYVGMHTGDFAAMPFQPVPLGQIFAPYILGTEFYHDSGYAGVAFAFAGICGLFGAYMRPLRILLGGWIFFTVGATISLPYFQQLIVLVPGVKYTAFTRYLDGTWEFSLALLAGFFMHDLMRDDAKRWVRCAVATAIFPIGLFCFLPPADIVTKALAEAGAMTWFWTSVVWAFVALGVLWAVVVVRRLAKYRVVAVAAVVLLEAYVNYSVPTLGFPTEASLSLGSVDFLRSHLGLQRFFTFGPIWPSYGSYYQIASFADQELPVPANWADYEISHLDSQISQGTFIGQHFDELARNVANYENAAVKYIVIFRANAPDLAAVAMPPGTKLDYTDDVSAIYELPAAAPYFEAPGCNIDATERTSATLNCPGPSTLTRRELFSPGWTASVNGTPAQIAQASGLYQAIAVPAGKSTVSFSFAPLFIEYGYAAFALGMLSLLYQTFVCFRMSRAELAEAWRIFSKARAKEPIHEAEENSTYGTPQTVGPVKG